MRLAALASVLLTLACARQTPVAAYASFVQAARRGESDQVWSMLSKESRARLDALAKDAAAAAPNLVADSGKRLVLGSAADAATPIAQDGLALLRESADRAILRVTEEGGRSREVTLVQEGGWRVDLTGALEREGT